MADKKRTVGGERLREGTWGKGKKGQAFHTTERTDMVNNNGVADESSFSDPRGKRVR
jgi:hypothetical protein